MNWQTPLKPSPTMKGIREMIQWRTDMENAPRDGTQVLITNGETYAVATWEDCGVELWDCGWVDMGDMGWGGMIGEQPTAWASINPPEEA